MSFVRTDSEHKHRQMLLPPQCSVQCEGSHQQPPQEEKAMRPSVSVTLDPGLEQAVPWGRDLYTFVTSAAGHMMRTLQKPRKNRPSKRQVNHRRFLHNMIQRKFADIEAANHRLASALYFKDKEKTLMSPRSQKQTSASPEQRGQLQDPGNSIGGMEPDDISKSRSDISSDSQQTHVSEKNHQHSTHLQKQPPKYQLNSSAAKNNQDKERKKEMDEFTSVCSPEGTDYHQRAEVFHTEYYNEEGPLKSHDTQTALQNSSFIQFGQNMNMSPSCSPELSPLSLDSCDFSIQMFTDVSTCTQTQKSITDIAESPWADIMDLFNIGNKDTGGNSLDIGDYQSICVCQEDMGQEMNAENQSERFTQRLYSNTSEMEDIYYVECEYGHSCHGHQESTLNAAAETQFNSFRLPQGSEITQNQLFTPVSCNYMSHIPMFQQPEQLIHFTQVNCENHQHFTPFAGVAQSFSAPLPNPDHRPIPTPPHEHDWLFPDILKDRKSPDC